MKKAEWLEEQSWDPRDQEIRAREEYFQALKSRVCSAGFQNCFGPETLFYLLFPYFLSHIFYNYYPMPVSSLHFGCIGGKYLIY